MKVDPLTGFYLMTNKLYNPLNICTIEVENSDESENSDIDLTDENC